MIPQDYSPWPENRVCSRQTRSVILRASRDGPGAAGATGRGAPDFDLEADHLGHRAIEHTLARTGSIDRYMVRRLL